MGMIHKRHVGGIESDVALHGTKSKTITFSDTIVKKDSIVNFVEDIIF